MFTVILAIGIRTTDATTAKVENVPLWSVHDLTFTTSGQYSNPYTQIAMTATFTGPDKNQQVVKGFWDGGKTFKVRWTPTARGTWSYITNSSDEGLNGKTGSFACTAPAASSHGYLRRDLKNPYHFVFDDGTRHFMWGTTYYALMQNAAAGDRWKEAVDKSKAFGINKVRMLVWPPWGVRDKVKYSATPAFVNDDHDRLNPAHWQKLDEVVRYMGSKGIIADLIIFWNSKELYGTEDQDHRYLRYVIARYAAFPNVIWCMTNEWNYTPKPIEYWNRIGSIAKGEDPYENQMGYLRLLSIHQQTRHDFQFFDQPWVSHAIVQLGVRNQGKTFRGGNEWDAKGAAEGGRTFRHGDEWGNFSIIYNWNHNMPVVNDEYGYIGEPEDQSVPKGPDGTYPRLTRDKHRQIMWGIAAASGYASAGDKNSYPDGSSYFSANWHEAPEYEDIKRLIDFWTTKGIEYWKMSPQNALVKSGTRIYVTAEPGRQYVVYLAVGGHCSLDVAPGTYNARRYNPRTGEDVALAEVEGGTYSLRLPDNHDWVVYLTRKNSTNPASTSKK